MKQPLSDRQAAVLAVMLTYRISKGYWPSRRELAEAMRPPTTHGNGIGCSLEALVKKGWLRKHRGERCWELVA